MPLYHKSIYFTIVIDKVKSRQNTAICESIYLHESMSVLTTSFTCIVGGMLRRLNFSEDFDQTSFVAIYHRLLLIVDFRHPAHPAGKRTIERRYRPFVAFVNFLLQPLRSCKRDCMRLDFRRLLEKR